MNPFFEILFRRNDPPGQSTVLAGQELLRMTESNPNGLPSIDPIKDLNLQNLELVESFQRMKFLEDSFPRFQCINDPRFEENVSWLSELTEFIDSLF